jgi:osmotically inducible lipoprotein OsmB
MKKWLAMGIVALSVTACGQQEQQRTVTGAALGGAAGAVIGAATGGTAGAAIAGGAIGAVAGGVIGNATTPRRCYYDRYGNRRCVVY